MYKRGPSLAPPVPRCLCFCDPGSLSLEFYSTIISNLAHEGRGPPLLWSYEEDRDPYVTMGIQERGKLIVEYNSIRFSSTYI